MRSASALSSLLILIALVVVGPVDAAPPNTANATPAQDLSGVNGFAFEIGHWRVHHRVLKKPDGAQQWVEFEGTSSDQPIMGGLINVEDNVFHTAEGTRRGVAVRSYDRSNGTWAIWWIDERFPHAALDPPVVGRFVDGVGTFYSDGTLDGKPMRTRFVWSRITPTSARWEQAYSYDAGKTWQVNWIMTFERMVS